MAVISGFVIRAYADQARLVDAVEPPRQPLSVDRFTTNLLDLLDSMLVVGSTAAP